MMGETYNIKWKAFPNHLVGAFKDLGEEGHFTDVTLVSDDQIQTPAHKVVLSACSPVLKALLVKNPHSHPLLYLRGIKQTELMAILQFMYAGETKVNEDRMNKFISVAKDLEVNDISKEEADIANELLENLETRETLQENVSIEDEQLVKSESIYEDLYDVNNHQSKEDSASDLQKTLQESVLFASNNINPKTWPDPHFCKKCGWLGQGRIKLIQKITILFYLFSDRYEKGPDTA